MNPGRAPYEKVLVTVPQEQLRVIDGLVAQGIAPTRSALVQQIVGAFVTEASRRSRLMPQSSTQSVPQSQTIGNAVEALIAYFLYSLGRAAIDELFRGGE